MIIYWLQLFLKCRAVAVLRHEEAIASSLYERRKNGIGVMMHELTFSKLVVESQYLLYIYIHKTAPLKPNLFASMSAGVGNSWSMAGGEPRQSSTGRETRCNNWPAV